MKNKFNIIFFSSSLLYEIFLIVFIILNGSGNIPLYMFIYFELFFLFLLGYFFVKKNLLDFKLPFLSKTVSKLTGIREDLSVPAFIIITGMIFRITLFPAELTTSEDALRYIWEGKVTVNGFNPYEYEPVHPALNHLHTNDLPSKINYNEHRAIYPPGAQIIFAAAYLIAGDELYGLKIILLISELLTLIFLLKLIHLKKKNLNYVIYYAWLPLPVMEFFVNTHLDAAGIALFIIFLYMFEKGKYYHSAVFFSLAFVTRFYPVFVLPLIFKKAGLKKSLVFGLISALITLLFYIPFFTGTDIFSFLFLYLSRWEFNASIYYLLKLFMLNTTARLICTVLFAAVTIFIAFRYEDFSKGVLGVFIGFILFASTVYPWYLGWLAAVNPLFGFYSITSLMFTSNLSNFTPLAPVWKEYLFVLLAEYVTFAVLLVYDYYRKVRTFRSAPL